jgi:hypothetical protein
MTPKTQAELEQPAPEAREEGPDFEPDTSHPDFRGFQATFTTADLDRRMDDIESGRTRTVPWEEVKRRGDALRNR